MTTTIKVHRVETHDDGPKQVYLFKDASSAQAAKGDLDQNLRDGGAPRSSPLPASVTPETLTIYETIKEWRDERWAKRHEELVARARQKLTEEEFEALSGMFAQARDPRDE